LPTNNTDNPVLLRFDEGGITTLTLNRPGKFNALSTGLMSAIQSEFHKIAADTSVRVVIIAGNGRAFCAGHDLKEMMTDPSPEPINALFNQCSDMMMSLIRLPQPVIAKVHGIATAAGCQLVAQCDLAIASDEATFATSGIGVGLYCGTPSVAVTRNLSRKHAMELLMTGDFIDADTACQYGLINRSVPADELDDATLSLASKIAAKGPSFVARGKELFYTQLEQGMSAAYTQAAKCMVDNMQDPEAQAGLKAFIEKSPMPDWSDR
jgi:enoyl-CoA hydratase/carnithine racemase